MNAGATETLSVVVERELPHPPEKIWRALTQPHLVAEWLMEGDIRAEAGHAFSFDAEWGAVNCRVLEAEPPRTISYSWGDDVLKSVVTWTLTPTVSGTHLRMEQTGFPPGQPRYYGGARAGWPVFLERLEQLLERIDRKPPNRKGADA